MLKLMHLVVFLFSLQVVIEGRAYDEAFLVPIFQTRRGAVLKLGKVVLMKSDNDQRNGPLPLTSFLRCEPKAAIREIAISLDLEEVTLTLVALNDLERIPKGSTFKAKLGDIDLSPEKIWEPSR